MFKLIFLLYLPTLTPLKNKSPCYFCHCMLLNSHSVTSINPAWLLSWLLLWCILWMHVWLLPLRLPWLLPWFYRACYHGFIIVLSWFYRGFTRMHARTPSVLLSHSHIRILSQKRSLQKAKNFREFERRQV